MHADGPCVSAWESVPSQDELVKILYVPKDADNLAKKVFFADSDKQKIYAFFVLVYLFHKYIGRWLSSHLPLHNKFFRNLFFSSDKGDPIRHQHAMMHEAHNIFMHLSSHQPLGCPDQKNKTDEIYL